MSTICPQGENLRKAIQWISQARQDKPDQNGVMLAEQAAIQFDLSPDDSEFLLRFVKELPTNK
ncbi:MAG: hypothetical protein HQK64_02730 [Desulfamplus sp.]|nr:hypothetical protein [Desulfamplus sp.]MBF0210761.1 hypothetical protein [Desulfamplus sp.]MBF0241376.1 hypothetical protein [Desulfamplus sp.]MBF0389114.1 hypothetical protein [Desulfamplus sp.]